MNTFQSSIQQALRDGDDTIAAYEVLRPVVFDYVMRMTGRRDRAMQVSEELEGAIAGMRNDAEGFVVDVLRTARSFAADVWNAETDELINLAFEAEGSDADLRAWEERYRILKGALREWIALSIVYELPAVDVEAVMALSPDEWESLEQEARRFDFRAMKRTKLHPWRIDSHHPSTVALSQLIGDIEESSGASWKKSLMLWVLFALLLGAAVVHFAKKL